MRSLKQLEKYKVLSVLFFLTLCLVVSKDVFAQEVHEDLQAVYRAEVVRVVSEDVSVVPGTDVDSFLQVLDVRILEGKKSGEVVTIQNDFVKLEEGDKFFLNYLQSIDGIELYSVRDFNRTNPLLLLLILFVAVVVWFGGKQGIRSLVSLFGSLLAIMYLLVPSLMAGMSPVPVSIAIATVVLFCAIFFTHGFNRRSAVAFSGTIISVALTGILAKLSIQFSKLTGFYSDEVSYLNLGTGGDLDFVGLLLAAIIIGALGVLDDIAVTQVAVVRELYHTEKNISRYDVYKKALRVGQEHVGALVNTLVLAYVGASLPIIMLFSLSQSDLITIINGEMFATEIIRAIVGSIGLIFSVPITTFLAAFVLEKYKSEYNTEDRHFHSH